MDLMHEKYDRLKDYLRDLGSVAVAYSSGVDSTFLLQTAKDVLKDNAIAVTAIASSFPKRETLETRDFCKARKIKQIEVEFDEFEVEGFKENPPNRCYLCKRELFGKILAVAKENNLNAVVEGSNVDDMGDYRPGLKAVDELGIKSPLRECGLTKSEIRALSKELDLPTWSKPSFACLASRFVYGETISKDRLNMVEKAEQLLMDMGFVQFRVRLHGAKEETIARIEVLPEEFHKIMQEDNRAKIYEYFKRIGFSYVAMDLMGYRTGSMNETLFLK